MRTRGIVTVMASAFAVAMLGAHGCGGGEDRPSADAGSDTSAPTATGTPVSDGGGREDASGKDAAVDAVASIGEGWEAFDDYSERCGFGVAPSREKLPPPVAWEPCASSAQPNGIACRQMQGGGARDLLPRAWMRGDGTVFLFMRRSIAQNAGLSVVAEADGPMHHALLETKTDTCVASPEAISGGRFAYHVLDDESRGKVTSHGGGAIGGAIDDLRPRVYFHYHDDRVRSYIPGAPGLLELNDAFEMRLYDWASGALLRDVWSAAQDNGLNQNHQFFVGDALFWASDSSVIRKQKVFTTDGGTKDLIAFGDENWKQAAGDLAGDGTDLVWLEGANRTTPSGIYPSVAVMTSKFTTDPTAIQARRLRSDVLGDTLGISAFVVGCGYAARGLTVLDGQRSVLLVVRLADGRAWYLEQRTQVKPLAWSWDQPLAVTCDELFTTVTTTMTGASAVMTNIARVRLDSLGPGIPAN